MQGWGQAWGGGGILGFTLRPAGCPGLFLGGEGGIIMWGGGQAGQVWSGGLRMWVRGRGAH